MNLTRSQKIRLGAFMLVGIVATAAGLLTLAGLQVWQPRDRYTVRFNENITGLESSAPVRYQGLRVGTVETMRVSPDDPQSIEVSLALVPGTVLYEGTTATLQTSGLTGLKTINLTPGNVTGKVLEVDSEIPAGASFVERITGQAEKIAVKVEMVTNQLVKWTGEENRQQFTALMGSLNDLSVQLTRFLETNRMPFSEALGGVGRATEALADASADFRGALRETRGLLKALRKRAESIPPDSIANTLTATQGAMRNLERRLSDKEFGKVVATLQTGLADFERLLQDTDLAVRAGREDFTASLSYIRQAAEDLREFSRIIAQDPSVLLRGREVQ